MIPQVRHHVVIDSKLARQGEEAVELKLQEVRDHAKVLANSHGFKPQIYHEQFVRWFKGRVVSSVPDKDLIVPDWKPVLAEGGECQFVVVIVEGQT